MILSTLPSFAQMVVVPPDLDAIIKKIEQRQLHSGKLPDTPAKIIYNDHQVLFVQPNGSEASIVFNRQAKTMEKHFKLKSTDDGYAFVVILQGDQGAYDYQVHKIHGAEALFCFGQKDVFIYTQQEGKNGIIELKEWIYALQPNVSDGSQWSWIFKSEPWQWPLTLEMDQQGGVVNRNMPFAGIPINGKARSQYMLNMMVAFKKEEPVKKYFPYVDPVVKFPKAYVISKEGMRRAVDVSVMNITVDHVDQPKPKVGLDFNRWDEHWTSMYKMSVKAKEKDYPFLIE